MKLSSKDDEKGLEAGGQGDGSLKSRVADLLADSSCGRVDSDRSSAPLHSLIKLKRNSSGSAEN